MLQTQKVRLIEFLDERAASLTQFAEEANAGIDRIGENALKELDQASARIMENIENQMQAVEEYQGVNRREIEENERHLAEFEDQIERERNEGLFFKSLTQRKPVFENREKVKEELEKIRKIGIENATGSRTRRNVYLVLVDAIFSSPSYWQKPIILGFILVGWYSQIIYEQRLISDIAREKKLREEQNM